MLLALEGESFTTELMNYFACLANVAISSTFVQQRGKSHSTAVPPLFDLSVLPIFSF